MSSRADVAVIGGSGFYSFLDRPEQVTVATPYGEPSAPVSVGEVAGRRVAFLPRHGPHHEYPPHLINYRANLWALRSLGVRQVLAPCAVGGLRDEVAPGDLVVPDQLVDRTSGRTRRLRRARRRTSALRRPVLPRLSTALAAPDGVRRGGTMVVGRRAALLDPRRVTGLRPARLDPDQHDRAPEAALARELRMCLAAIALVTDMDAGAEPEQGVQQQDVFALFAQHTERLKALLAGVLADLPDPAGCTCDTWADGLDLGYEIP